MPLVKYGGLDVIASVVHDRGAVYGTLASIFASLLGFIIAAVTIVLGHAQSPKLAVVRDSRWWSHLWTAFTSCMWILAAATLVALAGLTLSPPTTEPPSAALVSLLVGTSATVLLRVGRAVWVLEKVVETVSARQTSQSPSRSP